MLNFKTKKMITKKTNILVLLIFSFISFSCNDFLDVNDNPNNPTVSTPDLTISVVEADLLELNSQSMNYLGNYMVYNWSSPSNWNVNLELFRYNFTAESFSRIFEESYADILKNIVYIENFKDGVNNYDAYKVAVSTLKAFQYQYLVDIYGDVPYTEANLRDANITPAYDDAETVYKDLINELTETAVLATNLSSDAKAIDPLQDFIFEGHVDQWAQFANTIKLRYLIRLSNTGQDAYIISEIAKINANGAGYITSDVTANPGYSSDAGKQNPFYDYVGFQPGSTSRQDRGDFTVASDYVIEHLTTTNDPRIGKLYSTAKGIFKGAKQTSVLPAVGFTTDDLSQVGEGLLKSADQDQPLMLLSESLFLQAEAMVRGYIPGGDAGAKMKYEEAVTNSFTFLGVTSSSTEAATYLAQTIPNVSWDSSTDKIEAIITQKWTALNGTSGIESWIELTRTGFPKNLPLSEDATSGKRPVRLLYPSTEVSRNSENVPSQTSDDVFNKNPFWK